MLCPEFYFYFIHNHEQIASGYSTKPEADYDFHYKKKPSGASILHLPLTIAEAEFVKKRTDKVITGSCRQPLFHLPGIPRLLSGDAKLHNCKRAVQRITADLKGLDEKAFHWVDLALPANRTEEWPAPEQIALMEKAVDGRILFRHELLSALAGSRLDAHTIEAGLQYLVSCGRCEILPSISILGGDRYVCNRCGQSTGIRKLPCSICRSGACHYCEECAGMGEAKQCMPLYAFPGMEVRNACGNIDLVFPGRLTAAQKNASDEIKNHILLEKSSGKAALVWAACGAGKTEVVFEAIRGVLVSGGRVLFAIPRRDVVIELEERIRKAFPGVSVTALYGGSAEKYPDVALTIATTHQVIRFYHCFDLIVLDEMDAFPYQGSEMLQYAVFRAKKKCGRIIFMTATPSAKYLQQVRKSGEKLVKIPARHHRFPLPVPEIRTGSPVKGHPLYEQLLSFIRGSVKDGKSVFVFVPTIALAERTGAELAEVLACEGIKVDCSHSKDANRDQKKTGFAGGNIQVLVTTTIMERGITVPNVNVLVLYADNERIFNEQSLIQMAGRAGRTSAFPTGRVWFAAGKTTAAMLEAVKRIKSLNKEAFEKGYIDVESVS